MTVLSAGTDGIDGNSPAARPPVVDGSTLARAKSYRVDAHGSAEAVRHALSGFNAYPFL